MIILYFKKVEYIICKIATILFRPLGLIINSICVKPAKSVALVRIQFVTRHINSVLCAVFCWGYIITSQWIPISCTYILIFLMITHWNYTAEAMLTEVDTLRPRHSGSHFPDAILKCIFLNENVSISIKISLKFVPKVQINNIPALV